MTVHSRNRHHCSPFLFRFPFRRLISALTAWSFSVGTSLVFAQAPNQNGADGPPPWPVLTASDTTAPLKGTAPLTMDGDLASDMVSGIDAFLLKQIDESTARRPRFWKRDFSSADGYAKSVAANRQHLREMLGMRDPLTPGRLVSDAEVSELSAQVSHSSGVRTLNVRWPVVDGITGTGLLLLPADATPLAGDIVAVPDADQTPEDLANGASLKKTSAFALSLAEAGYRVLVPLLINRDEHLYKMPNREWLHRPAYVLGRTLAGYEVQKILAGIDALTTGNSIDRPLGVIGWGEGGRLALYAGALDQRIDATCVAGYFGNRSKVWNEPADRTVFGLLREFGDAEIASLIAPRSLVIEAGPAPEFVFRPDASGQPEILDGYGPKKGKPGILITPSVEDAGSEFARAEALIAALKPAPHFEMVTESGPVAVGEATLAAFGKYLTNSPVATSTDGKAPNTTSTIDPARRHADQLAEIERHNQRVLQNAYQERIVYGKDLNTNSLEEFNASVEAYRDKFRSDVIGEFPVKRLPLNPRSRPYQEGPKTVSYEVVLDTFPGVFAYGILTLPKDLKLDGSEKRPVVVCQHGLEGRPQDVISENKFKAYEAFATRLAERGFITFAPQNPYVLFDRFRTLQFKSAALGCTLFSTIVPQHQQIVDWLQEQAFVAGDRIGFYGLSYGGKSAMRIPALVTDYALSICSADFNEWVWKNAATDTRSLRYSYANKGEYEIFEYNLGGTFNYAEMAYLICPRPFMVERGHFDGVGPDDRVAQEFAKIRFLYQAKLGIGDRVEIEWFPGPHKINGVGSYDFLHRKLNWPAPK